MSFFLTEVRLLDLDLSGHYLIENIARLIANCGFEEERDSMGETSESDAASIDFFISHQANSTPAAYLTADGNPARPGVAPIPACSEIVTPPPRQ